MPRLEHKTSAGFFPTLRPWIQNLAFFRKRPKKLNISETPKNHPETSSSTIGRSNTTYSTNHLFTSPSVTQSSSTHSEIPKLEPVKYLNLPDPKDQHKLAFTYDNVLTKTECEDLINQAETEIGFSKDHTQFYLGRDNSRACRISPKFAETVYQRVKESLPDFWYSARVKNHDGTNSKWRVMGLNEFVRFYRYDPGNYFKLHRDGAYSRDTVSYQNPTDPEGPAINLKERIGERSFITFIVYLNEGFEGGETSFHAAGVCSRTPGETLKSPEPINCIPETGKALIFQHDILHEGNRLVSGTKYAFRMDVMYSRVYDDEQGEEVLPKNYQDQPLLIIEEDGGIII